LLPDAPSSSSHGLFGLAAAYQMSLSAERAEAELGDQHRAGLVQPRDPSRVAVARGGENGCAP